MSIFYVPKKALFFSVITILLASNMSVYAEGSSSRNNITLEELVVTARKVKESLQEAPVSVTAFSAGAIESAGIAKTSDFLQLTPNVTFAESQSIGTSFLTIRGVSQVRNGESPVAVVVDGVLQFDSRQLSGQLFDIEQIEVVKGPQGALYGRNATGGAIIINTKQPTNELDGHVKFGVGTANEVVTEAAVSGSIIDDELFFRVSGRTTDRDGYYVNQTNGSDVDPFSDQSIRARLLWQPDDSLEIDFTANLSRSESTGIAAHFAPSVGASATDANAAPLPFIANNEDRGGRDTDGLFVKVTKDLGSTTLLSVTSYEKFDTFFGSDQFPYTPLANGVDLNTPFGDGTQTQYTDNEAFSQEIRLTSNNEEGLRWQVGAYYLTWDRFISTTASTDTGDGVFPIRRDPRFNAVDNPTASFFADENSNTAWAVFGQLTYDISDQLELNVAGRYDEEDREQTVDPQDTGGGGFAGTSRSATFSKFQPKVTLRYSPSDSIHVYGSWGEGFRSGQFNQSSLAAIAVAQGITGVSNVIDQEETESSEIGIKTQWLDDRLRVNAACFDTTVENQQYFVFLGAISGQVLIPIDEVSLQGGEIDFVYRLTENLDIHAAYGFTDATVEEYLADPQFEGNDAPYVPESTFNAGFQWRAPLSESVSLVSRLDFERRGEQFWSPNNVAPRDELDLVNLRVGLEGNDGQWSLAASANNLTDEEYNAEYVLGGFLLPADPQVWRLDFRYNF